MKSLKEISGGITFFGHDIVDVHRNLRVQGKDRADGDREGERVTRVIA